MRGKPTRVEKEREDRWRTKGKFTIKHEFNVAKGLGVQNIVSLLAMR